MFGEGNKKQRAYQLGMDAELLAAQFLEQSGMEVLALRYRNAGGEIDLLARDGNTIVVVEVKARATRDDGLYSITPAKQKRLARAAEALLQETEKFAGLGKACDLNIRFDAVVIAPGQSPLHLPNAWQVDG